MRIVAVCRDSHHPDKLDFMVTMNDAWIEPSHRIRIIAVIALISIQLGCPGAANKPHGTPPHSDHAQSSAVGSEKQASAATKPKHGTQEHTSDVHTENVDMGIPSSGIACAVRTCMYHAGVDAYHQCLSGGAGRCFHYGSTCTPAHPCLYDRSVKGYRSCAQVAAGRCTQFGEPCDPPARCMYNPGDGLHHLCEAGSGGTCTRYGDLCDPS